MHLYLTAAVSQKGNSVEYMLIKKVCVCVYIMCVRGVHVNVARVQYLYAQKEVSDGISIRAKVSIHTSPT